MTMAAGDAARLDVTSPTPEAVRAALLDVNVWKHGAQRAPHKPLLLLLALAQLLRGEGRLLAYRDVDSRLRDLLVDYGPPRKSYHPEYPFWRLQNDGDFWIVPEREAAVQRAGGRRRSGDLPPSVLLEVDAHGGFSAPVAEVLAADPVLANEIAASILAAHFPASLHEDILDAVGMPWVAVGHPVVQRSPAFRSDLLRLYEGRCAVCGFDGRIDRADFGIEAAHIMWHSHGGPELCSLHHVSLDRGVLGISPEGTVLVSQHLRGGERVEATITRFLGARLRRPLEPGAAPAGRYVAWHGREVFRGPSRPTHASP